VTCSATCVSTGVGWCGKGENTRFGKIRPHIVVPRCRAIARSSSSRRHASVSNWVFLYPRDSIGPTGTGGAGSFLGGIGGGKPVCGLCGGSSERGSVRIPSRTPQWSRQGKPETLGLEVTPCNWLLLPSGCKSPLTHVEPTGQERPRVPPRQGPYGAGWGEDAGRVMAPRHASSGGHKDIPQGGMEGKADAIQWPVGSRPGRVMARVQATSGV